MAAAVTSGRYRWPLQVAVTGGATTTTITTTTAATTTTTAATTRRQFARAHNRSSPLITAREYRNRPWTQDSLGGNSRCAIIVTLRTEAANLDETVATLRFARRASVVQTVSQEAKMVVKDPTRLFQVVPNLCKPLLPWPCSLHSPCRVIIVVVIMPSSVSSDPNRNRWQEIENLTSRLDAAHQLVADLQATSRVIAT